MYPIWVTMHVYDMHIKTLAILEWSINYHAMVVLCMYLCIIAPVYPAEDLKENAHCAHVKLMARWDFGCSPSFVRHDNVCSCVSRIYFIPILNIAI